VKLAPITTARCDAAAFAISACRRRACTNSGFAADRCPRTSGLDAYDDPPAWRLRRRRQRRRPGGNAERVRPPRRGRPLGPAGKAVAGL